MRVLLVALVLGGGVLLTAPTEGAPATTARAAPGTVVVGTLAGAQARGAAPPGAGSSAGTRAGRWAWPLRPRPRVLRRFDAPGGPYAAGHRGLDLSAARGSPVRAVDAGRVTHVGVIAGRGTVTIAHADGLRSTYEPVRARVRPGDRVGRGAVIGTISGGGHCGGHCLHLGAARGAPSDGRYVDPWPLLVGPVVLLPLR